MSDKLAKNIFHNKTGFTIIEVLVTLLVFAIGLVAIYTLSEANLNSARNNFRKTLATNLGREAIELIRNRRDSNWLAIEANQDCDESDISEICTWDYGLKNNYVAVSFEELEPVDLNCNNFDECLGLRGSEIFVHNEPATETTPAVFYYKHDPVDATGLIDIYTGINRVVRLQAICRDTAKDLGEVGGAESISNLSECLTGTKIGVQVTVRLQWYSLNKKQSLDIVEKIYNWR